MTVTGTPSAVKVTERGTGTAPLSLITVGNGAVQKTLKATLRVRVTVKEALRVAPTVKEDLRVG